MKLSGIGQNDTSIMLRYELTFRQGWEQLLCLMQVFLDDLKKDTESIHYFAIAGSKLEPVPTPSPRFLHKSELLQEERGGVAIIGVSSTMDFIIKLTAFNQSNIVDVEVPKTEELLNKFTQENHLLDRYMSSLELNGRSVYSQKSAIEMYANALANKDDKAAWDKFLEYCNKIGVKPFDNK